MYSVDQEARKLQNEIKRKDRDVGPEQMTSIDATTNADEIILQMRNAGDPGARPGRWHPADAGPGDGGDPHLLPHLRDLRHDPGPAEPGPQHRPAAHGPHRRRQQPRRRQLHRRVHEPGPVLRAGPGHRGLDPPLGLLARPTAGWVPRRGCL